MEQIIYFLICYFLTFLLYLFFVIWPRLRYLKRKGKRKKKEPVEVRYLVNRYKLEVEKVNYKQLLFIVSLVSSLDISIAVAVSLLVDTYFLQLIIAFLLLMPLIFISYHFIFKYYQKKGLIKNV